MRNHYIKIMLLGLLCSGFIAGCQESNQSTVAENTYQALKLFPKGKAFSGFELSDQQGNKWRANNFEGNYSVVFFGFTHCPDICPTTLLDMQKMAKKLAAQGLKTPRFVFISVDSDRDNPAVMEEYINFFNPEFIGLTGDAANILSIASQLGVAYHVEDHAADALIYDVDHSSSLFLIDPAGERIGLFSAPHDLEQVTADLAQIMEPA